MKVAILTLLILAVAIKEISTQTLQGGAEEKPQKSKALKNGKNSFKVKNSTKLEINLLKDLCTDNPTLMSCVFACSKRGNNNKPSYCDEVKDLVANMKPPTVQADASADNDCDSCDGEECDDFMDLTEEWDNPPASDQAKAKGRFRRSTTQKNVCTHTDFAQSVVIYAMDVQHNEEVEIYHNIATHNYRTFYTKDCDEDTGLIPSGFFCEREHIQVKAKVWDLDDYSTRVTVVQVPAICTLQKTLT